MPERRSPAPALHVVLALPAACLPPCAQGARAAPRGEAAAAALGRRPAEVPTPPSCDRGPGNAPGPALQDRRFPTRPLDASWMEAPAESPQLPLAAEAAAAEGEQAPSLVPILLCVCVPPPPQSDLPPPARHTPDGTERRTNRSNTGALEQRRR